MGEASAKVVYYNIHYLNVIKAQGLGAVITTLSKVKGFNHRMFVAA
jgi:hypothetical protein